MSVSEACSNICTCIEVLNEFEILLCRWLLYKHCFFLYAQFYCTLQTVRAHNPCHSTLNLLQEKRWQLYIFTAIPLYSLQGTLQKPNFYSICPCTKDIEKPTVMDKTCWDKDISKLLSSNWDAKKTPPAQKFPLLPSLLNVAVCFFTKIFREEPLKHNSCRKQHWKRERAWESWQ